MVAKMADYTSGSGAEVARNGAASGGLPRRVEPPGGIAQYDFFGLNGVAWDMPYNRDLTRPLGQELQATRTSRKDGPQGWIRDTEGRTVLTRNVTGVCRTPGA